MAMMEMDCNLNLGQSDSSFNLCCTRNLICHASCSNKIVYFYSVADKWQN